VHAIHETTKLTENGQKTHGTYTIDINTTQITVGKQWVKSWGMYRWAGEPSTQVKVLHWVHTCFLFIYTSTWRYYTESILVCYLYILSPYLFAIYLDNLSYEGNNIKAGCYIGKVL